MQIVVVAVILSLVSALNDEASTLPSSAEFKKSGHTADSLDVVKERVLKKQAVLIDVREIYEWDEGHLKDAKWVPLSAVRKDELTPEMKKALPKDKPIYCHCMSGGRVLIACKLLREQGYDIRPLDSGYDKLLKAGFSKAASEEKED